MKNSKFLLAALVVFVTMMAIGFLMYGLLLKDFYRANAGVAEDIYSKVFRPDDQMNWGPSILSGLASALLMTTVLVWGGFNSAAAGARALAIFGLLMGISVDFGFMGFTYLFTITGGLVDVIANTISCGIVGALGGWVLSKGTATATA